MKENIIGMLALLTCCFTVAVGWSLAVQDAQRNNYKGTAPYLDCQFLSPCPNPRIIDPANGVTR